VVPVAELDAAGGELGEIATELRSAIEVLSSTTTWIMTNGLADAREALAGARGSARTRGCGWSRGEALKRRRDDEEKTQREEERGSAARSRWLEQALGVGAEHARGAGAFVNGGERPQEPP